MNDDPPRISWEEIRRQYDDAFREVRRNKLRPSTDPAEIYNNSPIFKPKKEKIKPPFIMSHSTKEWNKFDEKQKRFKRIFFALKRTKMNKSEQSMSNLLNELYPSEWKFVGCGDLVLNGLCPDFVNINKKQLIEFFGDFWHTDVEYNRTEKGRIKIFGDLGYSTLVIWSNELTNRGSLSVKIQKFVKGK